MHHATDVMGSLVLGAGRAALRAPRSPGRLRRRRDATRVPSGSTRRRINPARAWRWRRDVGRGDRSFRQDPRRRPRASCGTVLAAEGVTDPIWAEVPKSRLAPRRSGRRSRKAPTSFSCGVATARSSGHRRDGGNGRHPGHPAGRYGEPAGHQPGHPQAISRPRSHRPPRPPAASTGTSTVSISPSWPDGLDALMIGDADAG